MRTRSFAAAALALLIGGEIARLGWGASGLWRFVFPWLWLFVLLEEERARRGLDDWKVFLAGAAMAMIDGGIYSKWLQDGFSPLGIDWVGILPAAFDGGMIAVLALHVLSKLDPESGNKGLLSPAWTRVFLWAAACVAAGIYVYKTAFDFYRAERLLGLTWLTADILFAIIAWRLARRVWTEGGIGIERRLKPARSFRPAMAAAALRAGGVALLSLTLDGTPAAVILSAAIDWPSRVLFAWALLSEKLEV